MAATPPKYLQLNLFNTAALLFLFLHHVAAAAALDHPDAQPLMLFKSAVDLSGTVLASWNSSSDPCTGSWVGVSCFHNRVTRLVLENMNLQGLLPHSVSSLTQLRVLSLKQNGLSGRVPDLSCLTSLKLLFLSHNKFSGEFPAALFSLSKLYRLDLSYNNISGSIPLGMNRLTHLLTLRLDENRLTGPISGLNLHSLQDFNVSGNGLTGEIPAYLSGFPLSSFSNNPGLCGPPLVKCSLALARPGGAMASPVSPKTTVASSPTAMADDKNPPGKARHAHGSKISWLDIIAIIVGDVLAMGLIALILCCYLWKNHCGKLNTKKCSAPQTEKIVYSSSPYPNPPQPGSERGKMVLLDGDRRFELEDLLRASAEMLGKGGLGTSYKAILDDGSVVAVKRLKDLNVSNKKEFEQQMQVLGRLRHPNLVVLKAYYFARDEKLLVHDYMPNGNLFWLLHGNRGPGRTPLDWTTRLKIASHTAHGLSFLHTSSKPHCPIHGNIKSTNVLIDQDGNARLSDYGLSIFAPHPPIHKSDGYRAPEASLDDRKLTQHSDVYSFGVLLLELLTGKCPGVNDHNAPGYGGVLLDLPRWVQSVVREEWTSEVFDLELMRYRDIEEEMVGLLQVGLACVQAQPNRRPSMGRVVRMIDGLRGEKPNWLSESPGVSE